MPLPLLAGITAGQAMLGGSMIGAASNLFSNFMNNRFQKKTNEQNQMFIREQNAQNIALQREAWGREDTAVQRRAG
jgi:hypothetical protein